MGGRHRAAYANVPKEIISISFSYLKAIEKFPFEEKVIFLIHVWRAAGGPTHPA